MLQRCAGGFGAVALSALLAESSEAGETDLRDRAALSPFAERSPHYTQRAKNVIFL